MQDLITSSYKNVVKTPQPASIQLFRRRRLRINTMIFLVCLHFINIVSLGQTLRYGAFIIIPPKMGTHF